jgi:hypothetical protein
MALCLNKQEHGNFSTDEDILCCHKQRIGASHNIVPRRSPATRARPRTTVSIPTTAVNSITTSMPGCDRKCAVFSVEFLWLYFCWLG